MIRPLRRSLLLTSCSFVLSASAALAFNPSEGITDENKATALPTSTVQTAQATAPLYSPGNITPAGGSNYISPLAPIQMPDKPLYPSRTATAAPAPMAMPAAPVPNLPPVDPAVAARAQAIMAEQATPPAPVAVAQPLAAPASGFVAPAPVLALSPAQIAPAAPATPIVQPPEQIAQPIIPTAPVVPMPVPAATPAPIGAPIVAAAAPAAPLPAAAIPAPAPELSDQSRTILSHVPAQLDKPKVASKDPIKMDRVSPEIKDILGSKADVDSYEAVGLSIKVRRPGLDTNYELNRAYTALMGGDTQTAIDTYKNIISVEPRNEDALFGLAATYHRLGDIDKARPIYGMLLQVNPNHREGLNNFLVLVSDESPADALPELQRLEERNPEFSPIPAQIALVLEKMGYPDQAREKMLRAIELAPDNLTYKYNLAVMLDHQKQYADAAAIYHDLIDASLHGATVPASLDAMQKRLTYLVTEMTSTRTGMAR